ncbi:MAG: lipopolysaccharide transport periplasmic protein LptA, partial [Methylococcales bacterium]|nr:lipopolysaccharide transport periplasmic protein LptA [Methylococcales bacterium]
YYPSEDKLILIEEAVVSQGNIRSESQLIVYESQNTMIRAGDKSSDDKRVHSVFKSETKKQDNK